MAVELSDQALEAVVDTNVRETDPAQVYLFGSRARGDSRADSDVDLLIVQDRPFAGPGDRGAQMGRLWRLLATYPVSQDLLLFTTEEVERRKGSRNHIIGRALREGKLLYERDRARPRAS